MSPSNFLSIVLVIVVHKQTLLFWPEWPPNGAVELPSSSQSSGVVYADPQIYLPQLWSSSSSVKSVCGQGTYLSAINHINLANLTVDSLKELCRSTHNHLNGCIDHLRSSASSAAELFYPLLTTAKSAISSHSNICETNTADQLEKFQILLPCVNSILALKAKANADSDSQDEPSCLELFFIRPIGNNFFDWRTKTSAVADQSAAITHEMCCRMQWTTGCMTAVLEAAKCTHDAIDLMKPMVTKSENAFGCSDVITTYGNCSDPALPNAKFRAPCPPARSDCLFCVPKKRHCRAPF